MDSLPSYNSYNLPILLQTHFITVSSRESCKPIISSVSMSGDTGSPRILRMSRIPSGTAVVAKNQWRAFLVRPRHQPSPILPTSHTHVDTQCIFSERLMPAVCCNCFYGGKSCPPPSPAASVTASFMPSRVPTNGMVWFWGTRRTPRSIVYSAIQLCPDCARLQTAHLHLDGHYALVASGPTPASYNSRTRRTSESTSIDLWPLFFFSRVILLYLLNQC